MSIPTGRPGTACGCTSPVCRAVGKWRVCHSRWSSLKCCKHGPCATDTWVKYFLEYCSYPLSQIPEADRVLQRSTLSIWNCTTLQRLLLRDGYLERFVNQTSTTLSIRISENMSSKYNGSNYIILPFDNVWVCRNMLNTNFPNLVTDERRLQSLVSISHGIVHPDGTYEPCDVSVQDLHTDYIALADSIPKHLRPLSIFVALAPRRLFYWCHVYCSVGINLVLQTVLS